MALIANLFWRPGDGTETAVHVSDPWAALDRLDVRFPCDPKHAAEVAERNARWDAMQARKRAAAEIKPRRRNADETEKTSRPT